MRKILSFITPCFDEEASVRECYETIKKMMDEWLPG